LILAVFSIIIIIMLQRFLLQIATLLTVAILFGLTLKQLGVSLFYSIPLGVVLQFGIYYAYITALSAYVELRNKKLENERIKEFSLQGMEVTCPCALKKTEFVPIILNTNNTYKCNTCQKNISVYVVPETALITETIANVTLPAVVATEGENNGNS
jgi:hypothetical protein